MKTHIKLFHLIFLFIFNCNCWSLVISIPILTSTIYRLRRHAFPCAFSIHKYHFHELSSLMCTVLHSGHNKSRLPIRTSGSLSTNHCDLSGYPVARAKATGPRHPLDPVLLRHTQISPSACFAVGIIVPWRSNRRYVFFILFVYICSIAFPFRTCGCGPFFLELTIAYQVQLVIILVV